MSNFIIAVLAFSVLFILMLFCSYCGRVFGRWQLSRQIHKKLRILPVAEGAVFALLGLLIAFTFSGAYDRFENRKMRIIDEANAMETLYYQINLLVPQTQAALRASLKDYIDSEILIYKRISYLNADDADITKSLEIRKKIWNEAIVATKLTNDTAVTSLVISAVNNLFEIANTHFALNRLHPPFAIFGLLLILAMLSGFLTGYSTAGTINYNRIYIFIYVLITALTLYIIMDLEFPRVGLINVNLFDHLLLDVRKTLYPEKTV